MVTRILRLRLSVLANSFHRKHKGFGRLAAWTLIGAILAGTILWLGLNRNQEILHDFPQLLTVVGSLVLGLSLIVPLFMRGAALDPRQFSQYPVSRGSVARGLGLASFLSVPTALLLLGHIGYLMIWRGEPAVFVVIVLGSILTLCAAVLSARLMRTLSTFVFYSARARDFLNIIAAVLLLGLLPVIFVIFTIDWSRAGQPILDSIAQNLGWTPLGAAFSAPFELVQHNTDVAYSKLIITAGYVVILAVLWRLLVQVMMTRITRPARPGIVRVGMGWFERVSPTPAGVIGARSMTYWMRDPRYRVPLAILPLVPFAIMVPLAVATMPWNYVVLVPLPILCLLLSFSVHNDVAMDSTALWLHVSSATRGIDDRRGRLLPVLLFGTPLVGLGSIITLLFSGDWRILPAIIGVNIGILLVGTGVSSVISVLFPYAATRPGDSPFVQPQSVGSRAVLAQLLSLLLTIIFIFPSVALMVIGLLVNPVYHFWSLGAALAIGGTVFAAGLIGGARIFDNRSTELLAFTETAD
ncbi:hypothetical protein [Lysinibacter sp. HNR]|uniref:hypothetical protein n=1 Tax=Lysinibacter sp. HNR TaxID=3031408 RepID=UPI0024349184|nr:hypothetical protein [Lysinibacter sp. HNR]WGD38316.1 hypothetical protein FrondiHNR_05225 [Lysinibacter sp. HNR]